MRVLAIVIFLFGALVSSAMAKPKKQVPTTGDQAWVCMPITADLGPCEFDLAAAKDEDLVRVTYPKTGGEVRFRLLNTRPNQVVKIEFLPEEGYGNSMLLSTRGKVPRLRSRDVGAALDAVHQDLQGRKWSGLPVIVFFGRSPDGADYPPTFQKDLKGRYFGRFEILVDPNLPKGTPTPPIDVVLTSVEYPSSP